MSFGSNVIGSRFGRGREPQKDWQCICGTTNRSYLVQCLMCHIPKTLAEQAKETPDVQDH